MTRTNAKKRKEVSSTPTKKVSSAIKKKTKKAVSSEKKYESLFSRSLGPSQLNNNFNQLNRIKNAIKETSIMNEEHTYTEQKSSKKAEYTFTNKSLLSLQSDSTCYVNDEIVGLLLAILRDNIVSPTTLIASGLFFLPKLLNINDNPSSSESNLDFEYNSKRDNSFLQRMPMYTSIFLGLSKKAKVNIVDYLYNNNIKKFLVPVNIPHYHWMLLEINIKERTMQLHDSCLSGVIHLNEKTTKNVAIDYDPTVSKNISESTTLDNMNSMCKSMSLIDNHKSIIEAKQCLFRPFVLIEMTKFLIQEAGKSPTRNSKYIISKSFSLLINVGTKQQNPKNNNCSFCMVYNCECIAMNMTDQEHYGAADTSGRDHLAHLIFKLKKKYITTVTPTKPDNVEENATETTNENDCFIFKVVKPDGKKVIDLDKNIKKDIVLSPNPPELHKLHPVAKDVLEQINIRFRRITTAEYKENKKNNNKKGDLKANKKPSKEFFKNYLMEFGCFVFTKRDLLTTYEKKHHTIGQFKEAEKKPNEVVAFAVVEFNHQRVNVDTKMSSSEEENHTKSNVKSFFLLFEHMERFAGMCCFG